MKKIIRGYLPTNNGCGMLIIGRLEISFTLPHIEFGEYFIEVSGFGIEWEITQ